MKTDRPLFVPLKAQHFDRFDRGEKRREYRPYGPRWNRETCRPGRAVTLSRGYGKQRRRAGRILSVMVLDGPAAAASFADFDAAAWLDLYGPEARPIIAIEIELENNRGGDASKR